MSFGSLPLAFSVGGKVNSSFTQSTRLIKKELGKIETSFGKLKKEKIDSKPLTTLAKSTQKGRKQTKLLGSELKRTANQSNMLTRSSKLLNNEMLRLKTMGKIDIKLGNVKQQFSDAKGEALALGATVFALAKTYSSAANVLKAQGELATLKISEDGIKSITKSGQNMALQFGQVVAPSYIRAAYDIRSGISSLSEVGVNKFTKMSALTAIATKSSIEEMTKLNALGYGIFRKDFGSDFEFGEKFNAGISATVDSFRTDGSDLSLGLSNLGGVATAMGISFENQLAIIGTAKDTYNTASEATTGYKALLNSTGKAQEKLGMNFTNAKGKILPLADILDMLKDRYGDMDVSEDVELMEAFGGAEATKFIASIINKTDQLRQSTVMLQNSTSKGMPLVEEMAKGADRGYGFEKLGNAFSYMGYTIGKTLAPAVETLAWGIGGLAKGIAWLDSTFPVLTPLVFGTAAAFASLYAITKTVKLAKLGLSFANLALGKSYVQTTAKASLFSRVSLLSGASAKASAVGHYVLSSALAILRGGITRTSQLLTFARVKTLAFSAASKMAAAGQWALNVALNANPIGLLVTGVAALAAGAVYLYKNFEPFTNIVNTVWGAFKGMFSYVFNKFTSLSSLLSSIKGFFGVGNNKTTTPTTLTTDNQPTLGSEVASNVVAFKPKASSLTPVAVDTLSAQLPASNDESATNQQVKQAVIKAKQNAKQSAQQRSSLASLTQQNTIHVAIHNPTSDLDIERAISHAMAKQSSTMLMDEVI